MAKTYEPIATYSVTGSNLLGTTGVTFSSIPQTYTDLVLVYNGTLTASSISQVQVNGNTSLVYSTTVFGGNGSAAASTRLSGAAQSWLSAYAHQNGTQGNIVVNFFNYSNTTTNKTMSFRTNNAAVGTDLGVNLVRNTAAITSIKIYLDRAEYYVVGSTFTLYGIKGA